MGYNELEFQQARLNKLLSKTNKQFAVVLEGRDSAGKSGTIRELTHFLPSTCYRVEPSKMPSKTMLKHWLKTWRKKLPRKNEKIVFYDRSWYSRGIIQLVNNWCSKAQYRGFMQNVLKFETQDNIVFVKFWLSISEPEQRRRLNARKSCKLRYWKFSPNDKTALSNYDQVTLAKEAVFNLDGKFNSISFEDKKRGRVKLLTRLNDLIEREL